MSWSDMIHSLLVVVSLDTKQLSSLSQIQIYNIEMNYFSAMIRNPADVSNDMGTAALKGGEQRLEYREKLVLWGESVVRHRRHRARKAQQTRLGDILQWNP